MLNTQIFDDIAEKVNNLIPKDLHAFGEDIQKNIRAMLQAYFAKLDLVTREDFDTQTEVLKKTREKVELLEEKIAELEKQFLGSAQ